MAGVEKSDLAHHEYSWVPLMSRMRTSSLMNSNSPDHYEKDTEARRGSRQGSVSLNRNITARYVHLLTCLPSSQKMASILKACTNRIQNPLEGIPRATLLQNVEDFARDANLSDHIPLFQRAALVAQNPPAFETIAELEETEKEALRNEVVHKWRQPWSLYFTVILCSVGAAVQGWDQTGSNGANLSWPIDFGVPNEIPATGAEAGVDYDKNSWIVGVVNSGPYIASALL